MRAPSRERLLIHRAGITITMNNFQSPLDISINELIQCTMHRRHRARYLRNDVTDAQYYNITVNYL